MKHPVSRLCSALWLCGLSSLSYAADVPKGTVLAQKQELVRHIKDEPPRLIRQKPWGCPNSGDSRSL
jgi:oligopeptide transport system substrate-binding protein